MQELRRKLLAKQRSRVLYGPGYIMIYLEGLDLNSKWNRQWPSAETVFGCVNLKTHTLTQTHAHMYLYIYKYIYIIYIYRKSIFFRGSKHPFAHLAAWDKHGHHIYATSSGKLGAGRRKPGTGRSLDRRSCKKGWVQRGLNSLCFWYDFCVQES